MVFLNRVPTLKQNTPFMQICDFQPLQPIPFPFLLTSWLFSFNFKCKVASPLFSTTLLNLLLLSVNGVILDAAMFVGFGFAVFKPLSDFNELKPDSLLSLSDASSDSRSKLQPTK